MSSLHLNFVLKIEDFSFVRFFFENLKLIFCDFLDQSPSRRGIGCYRININQICFVLFSSFVDLYVESSVFKISCDLFTCFEPNEIQ